MDAYIFKADIYCESCGQDLQNEFRVPPSRASEDSDEYPQGPYPNGGGEADCPQHCGRCRAFLGNPLTSEGTEYVMQAIQAYHDSRGARGNLATLKEWQDFYGIYPADFHGQEIEL